MRNIRKYISSLIQLLILIATLTVYYPAAYATHNRAGEITYRQISALTYEITVYTYTNVAPGIVADRDELMVQWGDNTTSVVKRQSEVFLPNYYKRNIYIGTHTYPGPGNFEIIMEDPNRNEGVLNIKGSVNVKFAIKTTLNINPGIGYNNTPVLLNPPYDKAYTNSLFIHNPAAYDADGDSLSYKLATCLGDGGQPLNEVYSLPPSTDSIYIDPISGDLVWNTPKTLGTFNIAMAIEEWRDGIKIGQIIRDMQIDVYDSDNNPPVINPIGDFCVLAGDTVEFNVFATDPDIILDSTKIVTDSLTYWKIDTIRDNVSLLASGGPFIVEKNPAEIKSYINFNDYNINDYDNYKNLDTSIFINDNGHSILLKDTSKIYIDIDYEIIPETVIEFDFMSDKDKDEGEVQAIGFDTDLSISNNRKNTTFQIFGKSVLDNANTVYKNYTLPDNSSKTPQWKHYKINIGKYYTGSAPYLFFINVGGKSQYSNIRLIKKDLPGSASMDFFWATTCDHIRKQPYQIIFKAEDDYHIGEQEYPHVDFEHVYVTVVAPPPENLHIETTINSITLFWDPSRCSGASGYKIYRKQNPAHFIPAPCETGVPEYTGYKLIEELDDMSGTSYFDDNNERGLTPGIEYCYIITAVWPDGAESYASEEVCQELKREIPIITTVDVISTDKDTGEIYIEWSKPLEIDTSVTKGPFMNILMRAEGMQTSGFTAVDTIFGLDITDYHEKNIDTKNRQYSYKIDFWNIEPGNKLYIGSSPIASSNYLEIFAGNGSQLELTIQSAVPWRDTAWVIYRKNDITGIFDSIDTAYDNLYVDKNVIIDETYCYKTKSIGFYNLEGITDPRVNNSQVTCSVPIDTIAPCVPVLALNYKCDSSDNADLNWYSIAQDCYDDADFYNLYYSYLENNGANGFDLHEFSLLKAVKSPGTSYTHEYPPNYTGAFYITAVDSFKNESAPSNIVTFCCVDYKMPNIITPNNDGRNDVLKPIVNNSIGKVNAQIFNRWGKLLYKTDDPNINWDGKIMNTNSLAPDGVYYYVVEVVGSCWNKDNFEEIPWSVVGFFHLYSNEVPFKP